MLHDSGCTAYRQTVKFVASRRVQKWSFAHLWPPAAGGLACREMRSSLSLFPLCTLPLALRLPLARCTENKRADKNQGMTWVGPGMPHCTCVSATEPRRFGCRERGCVERTERVFLAMDVIELDNAQGMNTFVD